MKTNTVQQTRIESGRTDQQPSRLTKPSFPTPSHPSAPRKIRTFSYAPNVARSQRSCQIVETDARLIPSAARIPGTLQVTSQPTSTSTAIRASVPLPSPTLDRTFEAFVETAAFSLLIAASILCLSQNASSFATLPNALARFSEALGLLLR